MLGLWDPLRWLEVERVGKLITTPEVREKTRSHLLEVLRWSTDTEIKFAVMLSSSLGLAIPLIIGVLAGHPNLGVLTSLGSLMVRGVGQHLGASEHLRRFATVLAPALCAWIASTLIVERGRLTVILMVLLGAFAAVISGYSQYLAVATTRFTFALIITVSVIGAAQHRIGAITLMMVGALWTALLGLIFGVVARAIDGDNRVGEGPESVELQRFSANQIRIWWMRSLSGLRGWQYPLRITVSLAIAAFIASVWPGRHAQWIMVTVVLVTQRKLESTAVRTTQRILGTILGVIVASLLLVWNLPLCAPILVGLLGGVRPLLRARSYLLYSLVMTPLVLLLLDFGQTTDIGLLWERTLATLIGSGLVLATGMIVSQSIAKQRTA